MYIEFPQTCSGDSCHHDWRQQPHHDLRLSQVGPVTPAHCSFLTAPCSFLPSHCSLLAALCSLVTANFSLILASSHIQPWKPEEVVTLMSSTRLHSPGTLDSRLHISTIYTVQFSAHCKFLHFTLYHLLYTVHLYINTAQFTVHSTFVQYTLYNLLYTAYLYNIHCTVYCTLHIFTLYTVQFSAYSTYTIHTVKTPPRQLVWASSCSQPCGMYTGSRLYIGGCID